MEGISDLFPGWFTDIHDYHFVDRLDSDPGREWEKAVVGFLNTCGASSWSGFPIQEGLSAGWAGKSWKPRGRSSADGFPVRLSPALLGAAFRTATLPAKRKETSSI